MTCAVVGGGIIGLSIAWRLARRGVDVTVHDPGEDGAWWVAAGMLAAGGESVYEMPALGALMAESARRWPGFAAELAGETGVDLGYDDTGTLGVALTADDVAEAGRSWQRHGLTPAGDARPQGLMPGDARRQGLTPAGDARPQGLMPGDALRQGLTPAGDARSQGLTPAGRVRPQGLTPSALRELEPALSPRIRAGVHAPDDHQVDPRRVVAALRRTGVRVVADRVHDLGAVDADRIVVAAGHGTAALTGLPVRPVKGQLLRLRGEPGLLRHVIDGYADGRHVYLVPRADGEIVVGATQEERTDRTVTAGGVLDLLRAAVDLVPALADLELAETIAGHRPATPDNAPLLGRLDDRTIVAAGHHRNGVLLAPVTADLIADLVVSGEPHPLLAAFEPRRFSCS
jgi:glycine oxidase